MRLHTIKTSLLLLFTIILCAPTIISAQHTKPITLNVGDNVPSLNVYKWIKGERVANFKKGTVYVVEFGATWCTPCRAMIPHLSEISRKYKGSVKVISIFAMEDMNVKSTDKNPAYVGRVQHFVKLRDSAIDYIVGVDGPDRDMEKKWLEAAGTNGVPYSFVIDRNGKLAWVGTGGNELKRIIGIVTAPDYTIDTMLSENNKKQLSEIPYYYADLLLLNGNGGGDTDFAFRSVLAKSKGWIESGSQSYIDNYIWWDKWLDYVSSITKIDYPEMREDFKKMRGRVQVVNSSLMNLYYLAYGDTLSNDPDERNPYLNYEYPDTIKFPNWRLSYGRYWFKPVLEVKDESPFYAQRGMSAGRYNYSLKVQIGQPVSAAYLQEIMQRDLQNYFGYSVSVEDRLMPYWRLITIDTALVRLKLLTKAPPGSEFGPPALNPPFVYTNGTMRDIISCLAHTYGYGPYDYGKLPLSEPAPFIDETGIKGNIDFECCDRGWRFDDYKKYLNSLGLDVVKGKKIMKVVVIRDPIQ
jgi:thiol-disulfide isomerase/thioredoxin